MSDDVRRNRTSDTYYTNSLVKFDANSSVVPLTMYLASKRYGPIWMKIYYLLVYFNPYLIVIGAEVGGAAGAPAPPLLYNPRNFII